MRTISLRTNFTALLALAALGSVVEVARAQGRSDPLLAFTFRVTISPQVALGMINDETVLFWVHAQVHVFANGGARGTIQLREVGGPRTLLFRAVGGEVIDDRESGPRLELLLAQVGEDGEPLGLLSQAEVAPDRVVCFSHKGDIICLIYFTD
jgi:hypothetical protein